MTDNEFRRMSQFILELRKEKKLTQKELGTRLGVTDKAVSKWERGISYPDISLIPKLANILGVTTSELLNGEKSELSDPKIEANVEEALQYANTATKGTVAKSKRWKFTALVVIFLLLSFLDLTSFYLANGESLSWSILPVNIVIFVWLIAIFGTFAIEKNKIAYSLLCSLFIFITAYYYSNLNKTLPINSDTFIDFPINYIPHYNIILVFLIVSIGILAYSFYIQNKNISGDKVFLIVAANITIIILSLLTVSSMMDYVDIKGLGINEVFTVFLLLTFLLNNISLVFLAKHHRQQIIS